VNEKERGLHSHTSLYTWATTRAAIEFVRKTQ